MTDKDKLLKAALYYAEKLGLSIIPIKPNKKPYLASWEPYQKTKATSAQIKEWWKKWPDAMIGMVTGKISGLVVIDVDIPNEECMHLLSKLLKPPDALSVFDNIPRSATPNGGWHLFFRHPGFSIGNNSLLIPGADFRGDGGYVILPPSKNEDGKYYRWEHSILKYPPQPLPQAYIDYVKSAQRLGYSEKTTDNHIANSSQQPFTEGRRDEDLFHTANTLLRGGASEDFVRTTLRRLAKSCKPPFSEHEAHIKVDSALRRAIRRDRNIAEEARYWVENIDGYFDVNDFYRDLVITTSAEKGAAITAFQRLVETGILEKHGLKRGVYRLVQNKCETIDYLNAVDQTIPVVWPLGIEEWVSLYPGNICVIAGEKDAGKTAILLNFVRMNMDKHKIHYFSSEMGAIEFKVRLSKFQDIGLTDWNFFPKERNSQFEDVIQPNDINIIDFLEIYDEFYKVGFFIKQIFDKLDKGIAIIALQKNPGTNYGLGGMRSVEKARLYLAVGGHEIRIMVGKNWKNTEINPVGLTRSFKLVNGCQFIPTTEWERRY